MASSRHFCPFSTGKISLIRDGQSLFVLHNDKQGMYKLHRVIRNSHNLILKNLDNGNESLPPPTHYSLYPVALGLESRSLPPSSISVCRSAPPAPDAADALIVIARRRPDFQRGMNERGPHARDADGRGSGDNDDNRNRRQSKGSFFPSFALFLFSRKSAAAAPSFSLLGASGPSLLPPSPARFTLKECITNDDDRAEQVGQEV